MCSFFFFQAEDGIRDKLVTGVQTCALPISYSSISRGTISASGEIPRRASCLSQDLKVTSRGDGLDGRKLDREVAEHRRLPDHAEAVESFTQLVDMLSHFDHVVDVALRVGGSRDGDGHQVPVRRDFLPLHVPAEHRVADLARPDPAVLIDGRAEALSREPDGW